MELMAGQVIIGAVYRFTFDDPFTDLGYDYEAEVQVPNAGYYRVEELLTHEQILERGIDLVEFLYGLVNLVEADYQADKAGYFQKEFLQLVHVVTKQVVYMPATAISEVPIVNIQEYSKLVMAVNIGITGNLTDFNSMRALIKSLMLYEYGIDLGHDDSDPPVDYPEIMLYDTQWMTVPEYQLIEEARVAAKGQVEDQPEVLAGMTHPTNIWGEAARLRRENQALLDKINALEQYLVTLATPSPP